MATIILRFSAGEPDVRTAVGSKRGGLIRLRSGPGCGLFGPYVDLPAGRCVVRIFFEGLKQGHATIDLSAKSGETVIASHALDLSALDGSAAELRATLPSSLSGCEVRLFCEPDVHADITTVEIELSQNLDNVLRGFPLGSWVLTEVQPGLRLWVDLGDVGVSRQCLLGSYEPFETAFVEKFLRPGMALVDIGANVGWYSVIAAKIVGSFGLVYSIEPRPDTCSYLRRSMSENGFSQAHVLQLALSDAPGTLPIATFRADNSPGGTWLLATESLQSSYSEGYERFDTEVCRLDDLSIERCDLMKIDIEGAEYRALLGARGTLARLRPTIISEINPEPLREVSGISVSDYLAFITELGYEPRQLTPQGPGALLGLEFAANPPAVSNVLLVPVS
jgi:FkbM family methyltransferase